jgi:SAM-dependent methyltransferase
VRTNTISPREPVIATFRDPSGQLLRVDGRIVRIVDESAGPILRAFLSSKAAAQLLRTGALVESSYLDSSEANDLLAERPGNVLNREISTIVEHEPIPFPSFPYEWPPEMLASAGSLTLEIAETLLEEGFGLKDATPYNILFRGPRPVFVDVLSAEFREPNDPTWLPYAQFVRTFVLPLLVCRFCGIPSSVFLSTRRDGIEPDEVYKVLSFFSRLRFPVLTQVTLPTWLAKMHNPRKTTIYQKKLLRSRSQAQFVLRSSLRALRKSLNKAGSKNKSSAWTGYMDSHSYSADGFEAKRRFVEQALTDFPAPWLLDAGCNTGFFSLAAARQGSSVVAIDTDPAAIGTLWREAFEADLDILPLVVNLAQPSPATGWRNQECPSFFDRCRERFDSVLMLALVHHLMATEGIPLSEIFRLAKDMTRNFLIIEYIDPADPMFKRLIRGREALFQNLDREAFEASGSRFFDIVRSQQVGPKRYLYVMAKKTIR